MLVDARGPAGPDAVWRRFTEPVAWPTWAPLIRAVECDDLVLTAGSTGRVWGPRGVAVDFTVMAVDPVLRSWTWDVGRGPVRARMDHHVLPAAGGGTRALLRVPGRSATPLQPYRVPAGAALRRLVRQPGGSPEPVQAFDFVFAPSYAPAAHVFGITPPDDHGGARAPVAVRPLRTIALGHAAEQRRHGRGDR